MKRALDLALACSGLLFCAPIMLAITLVQKLSSPGPLLYRGSRVGKNGRRFSILKFRTMVVNAEKIGGSSTSDSDPRITSMGRFLRRWKLDELPQLWNVITGDMSLVGPRPQVEHDVAQYSEDEKKILTVRPGITDWSSIKFRNEGAILAKYPDPDQAYIEQIRPEKIRLQMLYIREMSFLGDLEILWATIVALFGAEVKLP